MFSNNDILHGHNSRLNNNEVITMRLIDADADIKKMCGCFIDIIEENIAVQIVKASPSIETKQIKYFDEEEKVWKIGSVIVDE